MAEPITIQQYKTPNGTITEGDVWVDKSTAETVFIVYPAGKQGNAMSDLRITLYATGEQPELGDRIECVKQPTGYFRVNMVGKKYRVGEFHVSQSNVQHLVINDSRWAYLASDFKLIRRAQRKRRASV